MAEDFTYINYSVEDIERYLGGRMDAKDMHAMERAALQDPFLADATEGFQHQPFTQTYQHLDEIAAAIQGEKEPAKIVPLPVKTNYWWRVAAVVGLIFLAGGVFWYTQAYNPSVGKHVTASANVNQKAAAPVVTLKPTNDSGNLFADNTSKNKLEKKGENGIVTYQKNEVANDGAKLVTAPTQQQLPENNLSVAKRTDSVKDVSAGANLNSKVSGLIVEAPANTESKKDKQDDSAFVGNRRLAASVSANKIAIENNRRAYNIAATGPTANVLNTQPTNVATNNVFINNRPFTPTKFEGFVLDDKSKPLANATVYSNDKKHATLTDSRGYFMLNTTDSQLAVQVASVGYYTKLAQLNNNAPTYITVNPQTNSLADVEVTQYKNMHLAKKMLSDSLIPEGGWQSFREYVYKKLHKEKDMDTTGAEITMLDKSVEIEFVVDENGLAKDLKITKSLNGESDAKALQMVQQWPRWIATKKDRKGKVVIQF